MSAFATRLNGCQAVFVRASALQAVGHPTWLSTDGAKRRGMSHTARMIPMRLWAEKDCYGGGRFQRLLALLADNGRVESLTDLTA